MISSAEAKAAKAVVKADGLRIKLVEATKASAAPSLSCCFAGPISADSPHLHKKSKGMASASSPVITQASTLHQSPQRKEMTANKRMSIQSPSCFSSIYSVSLSSSSFLSSSSGSTVLLVGEDSDNELKISPAVLSDGRTVLLRGKICLDARRGRWYGSPTYQGCSKLKPVGHLVGAVSPQNYKEPGDAKGATHFCLGVANATQRHGLDNSPSSSDSDNGSWTDDMDTASGDEIGTNGMVSGPNIPAVSRGMVQE
jgi:hypothetical protein